MSKTVVEQLSESQAEVLTLKASVESLTADHAKAKETIAAMQVTIDAAAADKAAMESAHAEAMKEASAKLETEAAAHAVTVNALAEANKKLADPAYRMASAEGDKAGVPEGAPAKSEPDMTPDQAMAEYRKLDGKPEQQKAFRAKHWRVLGCDEES
jgi:chromosome segregation ATPase